MDLKIQKIDNDYGIILPGEALTRLGVEEGDNLFLMEGPDGRFRITPFEPEFEKQMTLAQGIMGRYRNTLKELSK